MGLEVSGKVFKILNEQKGTSAAGKDWVKQDFVIETDDQYPKKIAVTAMGDKIVPVVKTLSVGQQVTIHINIESREYQDKWFSNINVWRVDKLDGNSVPTNNTTSSTNSTKATKSNASSKDDDSELPF
jgi:hypothetical protein